MEYDRKMPGIEVGKVCVKTSGREAGRCCVIIDIVDRSFVLVTGPKAMTGIKRRKVNVKHLEITDEKVKISRGASDDEVMKALETSKAKA